MRYVEFSSCHDEIILLLPSDLSAKSKANLLLFLSFNLLTCILKRFLEKVAVVVVV